MYQPLLPPQASRLQSLDVARGAIMVVMAWDHAKDILLNTKTHPESTFIQWSGTYPDFGNNIGVFLARWISNFCAPGFFYLMGVGMVLFCISRERRGWTWGRIVRHFAVRGAVLIALGRLVDAPFVIKDFVDLAKGRVVIDRHRNNKHLGYADVATEALVGIFEVLTALGLTMICVGLLMPLIFRIRKQYGQVLNTYQHLDKWWNPSWASLATVLAAVGVLTISNSVIIWAQGGDPAASTPWPRGGEIANSFGRLFLRFLVIPGALDWSGNCAYPLIPWVGVALFGVAAGFEFRFAPEHAHRRSGILSIILFCTFLLVRIVGHEVGNLRGPPRGETLPKPLHGFITFFNVTKYPPSPAFVLLTLSVNTLLVASFNFLPSLDDPQPKGEANALSIQASEVPQESHVKHFFTHTLWIPALVYGRTPLFFYVIHFWLYAPVSCIIRVANMEGFGYGGCAVAWCIVLVILFPMCRAYGRFKNATPAESLWRLL